MVIMVSSVMMIMCSFFSSWFSMEMFLYGMAFLSLWWLMSLQVLSYEMENMMMFMDWLSLLLILLSILITALMVTASYFSIMMTKKNPRFFLFLSFIMMMFLVFSFTSSKTILFYVFFEASLIPIFLLIMGWGYQPERLQAGLYMLFYTIFASLPLLIVILAEAGLFSMMSFQDGIMKGSGVLSKVICLFFVVAFLVKLPMFMVHLWLPKAHVEAPVAGSMILAGVLLKLGSYGLWRVSSYLIGVFKGIEDILLVVGLVGGVIVSFVCLVQVDMKSLIAYSSVVHMGILLSGMMTFLFFGFEGALCMMLGHGLVSSGMFFLVGVFYDRIGSRSIFISKGMMIIFPALTLSWFVLSIFNISAPPSISLLGEIFLTSSILSWSTMTFFWLMLMNLVSMAYTFYLYAQSQQGKLFGSLVSLPSITSREYMVSLLHYSLVTLMVFMLWSL